MTNELLRGVSKSKNRNGNVCIDNKILCNCLKCQKLPIKYQFIVEAMLKKMFVKKRDGKKEDMLFDKITSRIQKLCSGLNNSLDPALVTKQVIIKMYPGIKTIELDNFSAEIAEKMSSDHPDYGILATRIAVSNLHKETRKTFSEVVSDLYHWINPKTGKQSPLISDEIYHIVLNNADTLEKYYLLKINDKVVERPQHMFMRVALGIYKEDIQAVIETYNLMSEKWFIHSHLTMVNSGTVKPQLSSSFLLSSPQDTIEGIFDSLKNCALISKNSGEIGLGIHCIRATGSYLEGIKGRSNGIVPMLRIFNATSEFIEQGARKKNGAFTVYLEPWHADIFEFLDLKKNVGKEELRARNLFYALWIPDLFMSRVEADGFWTLMCPYECPGLCDVWGKEFEILYQKYEMQGKGKKTVKAQKLWLAIIESQTETGTPYILYKDSCNRKSNHQNLGTIQCSNLCTELIEYSSHKEIATCCSASVSLDKFVSSNKTFDFVKLQCVTKVAIQSLNQVIDQSIYPRKQAEMSSKRHRAVGLNVLGLSDAFILMRLPFDSPEAKTTYKEIFETMYFAALMPVVN
ncbi:Ribonucleoside-diphosphate reductase large subunit [Bulinus truncatus]|nr:Ribonucleoside-diphosphate reductase large subunit [Bulinus truncatus]